MFFTDAFHCRPYSLQAKQNKRIKLEEIENEISGKYINGKSPWNLDDISFDFAFPCATQNEIDKDGAENIVKKDVKGIFEGANLPTSSDAKDVFRKNSHIIYIPGKAANAGGVGVSGFEMSQNAQRLTWGEKEVDEKLRSLMASIYEQMESGKGNDGTLEQGANRAGFLKVVHAMELLGWVY